MSKKTQSMTKQKFTIALFMLVISVVALTTASYAWFTANTTVSLEALDVNVSASNGIQISTDAKTWKARLTLEDIKGDAYTGHTNQIPTSIVPVSSALTVANGKLEMFKKGEDKALEDGTSILLTTASTEVAGNTGDFIAFDIFLQSAEETSIQLTAGSKIADKGTSKGIENASRVAFLNLGTAATPEEATALNGQAEETILWEPNADSHTATAILHASQTYAKDIEANTIITSYYGIKSAITEENAVTFNSTDSKYFKNLIPTIQTTTANKEAKDLITIGQGITKVRVYAWIEGQDVDCENNASGTDVTYTIGLQVKE